MKKKPSEYVALVDLAGTKDWPSRAVLFALVKERAIARFKFPGDRKTYVKLVDLERAKETPMPK